MVLLPVIACLVLSGVTTTARLKGNFECTKSLKEVLCSRSTLPRVKNGSFECHSNDDKMSSLGDICSLKCDNGSFVTLSNHTICEGGNLDQRGQWSNGNFECYECSDCVEWNGSLYTFINTAQSYENSRMMCQHKSHDNHLVYIENEEENEFVTRSMLSVFGDSRGAWIGLRDEKSEGTWTWGIHQAEYLNWNKGLIVEPNGGRVENNAVINFIFGDKKWYDVPAELNFSAVCEKEIYGQ